MWGKFCYHEKNYRIFTFGNLWLRIKYILFHYFFLSFRLVRVPRVLSALESSYLLIRLLSSPAFRVRGVLTGSRELPQVVYHQRITVKLD